MSALHYCAAPLCKVCGAEVSADGVGLNRKIINRGVTEYMCVRCLAAYFHTTEESLLGFADRMRASGCVLFPAKNGRSGSYTA